MQSLLLLILAIIPPAAFLIYVMYMDRREPEPWGFIIKVIMLGGLSCIPAGIIENIFAALPFFSSGGLNGAFTKSFFLIAPVEELAKLMVVLLFVWKSRHFNEINDGIVYVGTAAIGFAMAENIMYVLKHGYAVGFARAVTAIPLHTFSGVIMGYYVGKARFSPDKDIVGRLIAKGLISALIIHGTYDTFALSGSFWGLLLLPVVITIVIIGFRFLKYGRTISLKQWSAVQSEKTSGSFAVQDLSTHSRNLRPELKTDASEVNWKSSGHYRDSKSIEINRGTAGIYKIIISRVLFAGCIFLWFLLSVAFFNESLNTGLNLFEYIVGGTVMTILPIGLGVALELSHYRAKRSAGRRTGT